MAHLFWLRDIVSENIPNSKNYLSIFSRYGVLITDHIAKFSIWHFIVNKARCLWIKAIANNDEYMCSEFLNLFFDGRRPQNNFRAGSSRLLNPRISFLSEIMINIFTHLISI